MTNVLLIMPAERRDQWRDQFILGKEKILKKDRFGYESRSAEFVGVPEFSKDTVIATMMGLLNDRHKYLGERVYGVFKALSPAHKTNKTYGFSEKLIISHLVTDFWNDSVSVNYRTADYVNDLRILLHFFAHREFIKLPPLSEMLSSVYRACDREVGKWVNVDGNLMRVKIFKNGNLHAEIHPDVAWKLNEVLATMLPAAIPAPHRTAPNTRPPKEFGYIQKTISPEVRTLLRDLKKSHKQWWCSMTGVQKSTLDELTRVLRFIGGEQERDHWSFPYDPSSIIDTIISAGTLPETVTHQFYPSSDNIARYIAAAVNCGPTDTVLEPEVGRADLLAHINVSKENITCVDVSPFFVEIVRAKGYANVVQADFIQWSNENSDVKFDRIVMNPPYSEGRAKQHTMQALKHLKPGGILAAVLPAGYNVDDWIVDGYVGAKASKDFSKEFEETGIRVAVFVFKRLK